MSNQMNDDYYDSSDSSSDGGQDDRRDVDISDITGRVDLQALRIQMTYYGRPADPRLPIPFRDAQNQFNKYIPAWMDGSVTPWPVRHPALRPDNAWRVGNDWVFPSEYARRFGVDRRAPPDNPGRSMLTPNAQGPDAEWAEDWQAVVFHGYTADELRAQGAFDPDMQVDGSLEGLADSPIHPLLRRGHWIQSEREGITTRRCKLWYKQNGQDRRWDARTNDEVWDALQPVLRLMSKVLYSQHPFWRALCDITKLKPMDMSRVPVPPPNAAAVQPNGDPPVPQQLWSRMSTLHYEVDDREMYPEAKALRDSGFQSGPVVHNLLRAYLRFSFDDTQSRGAYATTRVRLASNAAATTQIEVSISPEGVWPLLLPVYSRSERFVAATALAAIILHELAHCARNAIFIMTETWDWEMDLALRTMRPDDDGPVAPELTQLTAQQKQLLWQLGTKIGTLETPGRRFPVMFPAFFFQDEFRAEEGWAFENQLWGGIMNTMAATAPRDGFPQLIGWLEQWPYSKRAPRPWFSAGWAMHMPGGEDGEVDGFGWPGWLLDPPPSVVSRRTALPVAMMSRLHDEAFWDTHFARFSHQALRYPVHQWRGAPLRSSFAFDYTPRGELPARAAWDWLDAAAAVLDEAEQPALAEWVRLSAADAAGPALARARFRVEARRWRSADTAQRTAAVDIDGLVRAARDRLDEWRAAATNAERAVRRDAYLDAVGLVAAAGLDAARSLGWEVSSLQFSLSECARLRPGRRAPLRGYLDRCAGRLGGWLGPFAGLAGAAVAEVRDGLGLQVDQRGIVVAGRVAAADLALTTTRALIDEMGGVVNELRAEGQAGGGAVAPSRYAFTLLAERSSNRLRRNRVERLTQRRVRELPGNSPELTLITAAVMVLSRCPS